MQTPQNHEVEVLELIGGYHVSNELPYQESELYRLRHTAAHVLAQAVLELYPEAKLGIGPPIEDGFYYDFDLGVDADGQPISFKPDDLPELEKRMRHDHSAPIMR